MNGSLKLNIKMNGNEYLVNRAALNAVMSREQLSDNSIASRLAPILGCSLKAAAVRIGGVRRGETIAADAVFLCELEKALNIKSGSLFGEAITKAELQRRKRLREKGKNEAMLEIKLLVSRDNRRKTVEVHKDFLEKLLGLL